MNKIDNFYKWLKIGLLTAGVVGLLAYAVNAGNLKDQAIDTVYKINENCSAVSVDLQKEGNFLLTAKHCVKEKKEGVINQITFDGVKKVKETSVYFEVDRTSVDRDLALLKVRDPEFKPKKAKVAEELLVNEGDDVWTVGYPNAWTRAITEGLYNEPQILTPSDIGGTETIKFTRASPGITGGNSGGGLFQKNKDNYELIGTTSMVAGNANHIGLYVTLEDIRKFLSFSTVKNSASSIDEK